MTIYYRTRDCEVQISEVTTARRQMLTEVGTAEVKTVSVSKAGGAFAQATGSATTLEACIDVVTLAAGDVDTEGELAVKLEGATHTDYVFGIRVVAHDPYDSLRNAERAAVGKVVTDLSDNSITVYAADGLTAVAKRIKTTAGTQTTWSPTTV